MRHDLNYYLKLEYTIKIDPIPKKEGGGFVAYIPQLGKYAFRGDGETREEALENLDIIKEELFREHLDKEIEIQEPETDEEGEFSGKFLVRAPKLLHKSLANQARKNGVSLNQYVIMLLARNSTLTECETLIKFSYQKMWQKADFDFYIEREGRENKIDYSLINHIA
ncbi:MAG: toxin-antitoxin system HicB family antitoxin [Candidatus Aminicenantes bacterium]|nr:toxin-antitoxin system HicB family antitoxin [Candidatus Aminicenantes bacterium]